MKQRLIQLLKQLSVKHGSFTTRSGSKIDTYIDVRQTALNHEGSFVIGQLLNEKLKPEVIGIGGMETGAIPVLMSAISNLEHRRHGFYIRKPKGYGLEDRISGLNSLPKSSKVCLVEDTTTSGGSLLEAIRIAQAAELDVIQTITVVDRQEGAEELLRQHGFNLEYLVNKKDLIG